MSEAPDRISVSRDALRAELAQLELRIVQHLDEKADRDELKALQDIVMLKADRTRVHNLESKSTAIDLAADAIVRQRREIERLEERVGKHGQELEGLRNEMDTETGIRKWRWAGFAVVCLVVSVITYLAAHYQG